PAASRRVCGVRGGGGGLPLLCPPAHVHHRREGRGDGSDRRLRPRQGGSVGPVLAQPGQRAAYEHPPRRCRPGREPRHGRRRRGGGGGVGGGVAGAGWGVLFVGNRFLPTNPGGDAGGADQSTAGIPAGVRRAVPITAWRATFALAAIVIACGLTPFINPFGME